MHDTCAKGRLREGRQGKAETYKRYKDMRVCIHTISYYTFEYIYIYIYIYLYLCDYSKIDDEAEIEGGACEARGVTSESQTPKRSKDQRGVKLPKHQRIKESQTPNGSEEQRESNSQFPKKPIIKG